MNKIQKIEKQINIIKFLAWLFLIIGFTLFIISLFILIIRNGNPFYISLMKLSYLGDFLSGTVTTFLSLSGVLFIYIAFLGQKQDLLLQKEELELTRNELNGQKQQLELQNKSFQLQIFENTLFNMLSLLHEIISTLSLSSSTISKGRDVFKDFIHKISNNDDIRKLHQRKKLKDKDLNENNYYCLTLFDNQLGHYYRHVFEIVSLIDNNEYIEDKIKYINILKSQLSNDELFLIFLYCLSRTKSVFNYKLLIEKYNLIEHIIKKDLVIDFIDEYNIK